MANNNLPIKYKESIFRRIFNKIKGLFSNNNNIEANKFMTVNNNTVYPIEDSNKTFRDVNKLKQDEVNIEPDTLDYALDQFLSSYYYNTLKTGRIDAYNALIYLGAKDIQVDDINKEVEENLLSELRATNAFRIDEQKGKNDNNTYFYHVFSPNYKYDSNLDIIKVYINCNRSNVASLAGELLTKMQDDNLYLKFSSDKQLGTIARSEAIVIYTDENNINNILNNIENIAKDKPELFKGSENMNPFLRRIGKVGYAKEIKPGSKYNNNKGEQENIAESYNAFLSRALEESFVGASKKVIAFDKKLTLETNGEISDDPGFYMTYFEKIKGNHYRDFLNIMKQELRSVQERNKCLDINGINDERGEMNNGKQI